MMSLFAGSKWVVVVAIASVAILILLSAILYIQSAEEDKILIDIQDKQDTKREVIRDAIKDSPIDRNDASDSLQFLNNREN